MTQDEREAMRTVLRENIGKVIRELLVAPLEAHLPSEIDCELLEIARGVVADITGKPDERCPRCPWRSDGDGERA